MHFLQLHPVCALQLIRRQLFVMLLLHFSTTFVHCCNNKRVDRAMKFECTIDHFVPRIPTSIIIEMKHEGIGFIEFNIEEFFSALWRCMDISTNVVELPQCTNLPPSLKIDGIHLQGIQVFSEQQSFNDKVQDMSGAT